MRWLAVAFLIVTVLVIGGWLCRLDVAAVDAQTFDQRLAWVRTVDGWERGEILSAHVPAPPSLHPLVIAAGLLLGSLLALSGFSSHHDCD